MAKKVTVTGYVAGGFEFSDEDIAMAKAWWNNEGMHQVEDGKPITKGRTPDAVLLAWEEAEEPQVELPKKLVFEAGDRKRYNAWLAAENKESSDATKKEWFDLNKPVPEGYVDTPPVKAPSDSDVLAVIYGNVLDEQGNVTDEKAEINVTRAMLKAQRGPGVRGAASAETLVAAANVDDAMENVAPVSMVRGDVVLKYENGAWVGSTQSKKVLSAKLNETTSKLSEVEAELMRKEAENKRLLELLEKAEQGINHSSVKKAPARRRSSAAKSDASA